MRTILTAAALAAFLATPALASEPIKLDDRQLDTVAAGAFTFPTLFTPFPSLFAPVTWGEPTTLEGPTFSGPGTLSVTFRLF